MAAATGKRRKVEEAIQGEQGEVFVRRERPDSNITVNVQCQTKEFTPQRLYECLEYIAMLGNGAWVALRDSNDSPFYVRLEGYDAELGDSPEKYEAVPWEQLRAVLEEARE